MSKIKNQYKYLLYLYSKTDLFLKKESISEEEFADLIVSFCIVVEKLLKIKLYRKNPFLVFDINQMKESNSFSMIAMKKENNIETSKIKEILDRFKIVFNNFFSDDEIQALTDIYKIRNYYIHSYKKDSEINFNQENLIKKIGTVWEKIFKIAIIIFGKEKVKNIQIKPEKKYTEKELENVLEKEVEEMIKPIHGNSLFPVILNSNFNTTSYVLGSGKCPRCGTFSFGLNDKRNRWGGILEQDLSSISLTKTNPVLYSCSSCNLELTKKQYEIAKKIMLR